MACKFCGEDLKLIKSHIVPEAFFRRMKGDRESLKLIAQGQHPKKSQTGVYDETILCAKCDNYFGEFDNYAQKLLNENLKGLDPLIMNGKIIGYETNEFRYDLLKLFFISLIWRASISNHPFFKRINLGPFEPIAKYMLQSSDPGAPDDFGVVLAHFDHQLGSAILDPHPEKFKPGINYNRFYLSRFIAYIKTDKRSASGSFKELQMHPLSSLKIISRDLAKSNELPLLYKMVNGN